VSKSIVAYSDDTSVRNAIDGQVFARAEGFDTLIPPVAMSPASTFGCSTVIPIFRRQAGTTLGLLFRGADQNVLSRLVVVRDADCK
jgi:hypothetical protein